MKDHIIGHRFKIYVNTRKETTKHFQAVGLIRDGIGSFRADLVCHGRNGAYSDCMTANPNWSVTAGTHVKDRD